MTDQEAEALGEQWLRGLLGRLITADDRGRYVFYNTYTLDQQNGLWRVYCRKDGRSHWFGSIKNAASWCILHHHNQLSQASRVQQIDAKLISLETHILIHDRLRKLGPSELREINRAKLVECLWSRRTFRGELDKYITQAQICQHRGFENELTRTSRKQKN